VDLLPDQEKRAIKVAKKLNIDRLSDKEKDEIDQEYYGVLAKEDSED
jgi:hypothetical protein